MNEIVLFDYWRSSASYRVRIVLNLKNVPYTRVPTSLLDNAQRAPDYVARNPQGFVPTLSIDGHDLDAVYPDPAMVSSNPTERAKTLAQALIIAADIHPIDNLRVLRYLKDQMGQSQEAVDQWYRHWITEGFTALEAMAPEHGLFGGDLPNLADVCLVPQMANARRVDTLLHAFPKLLRMDAALTALPAFAAAHPDQVKPD